MQGLMWKSLMPAPFKFVFLHPPHSFQPLEILHLKPPKLGSPLQHKESPIFNPMVQGPSLSPVPILVALRIVLPNKGAFLCSTIAPGFRTKASLSTQGAERTTHQQRALFPDPNSGSWDAYFPCLFLPRTRWILHSMDYKSSSANTMGLTVW